MAAERRGRASSVGRLNKEINCNLILRAFEESGEIAV